MLHKSLLLFFVIGLFISCNQEESGITSERSEVTQPLLSLNFPSSQNADSNMIEIQVASLNSGNTLNIYSDSECSQEIFSTLVESDSIFVEIDSLDLGVHKFYATQEDSAGIQSPCPETPFVYVYENESPQYVHSLSISSPQSSAGTSDSIEINLSGVTYGHTIVLCSDSLCNNILETNVASSETLSFSTQLVNGYGDYTFYIQVTNNLGSSDVREVLNYSYGTVPSAPFLSSDASGADSTPTIIVTGVSANDTVRIFSDELCSNELGLAIASGSSVDVISSPLIGFTTHLFYANTTNDFGTSSCSTMSASYELLDAYPVIDISLLASKRSNFVDCGQIASTIPDKILDCAAKNDGANVNSSNNLWKMVTRIGSDELWRDEATGLVWSSSRGNMSWLTAMSHCPALSDYGITDVTWYLPSKTEINTAYDNKYHTLIENPTEFHWSSTSYSSNSRWRLRWSDFTWCYNCSGVLVARCVFSTSN